MKELECNIMKELGCNNNERFHKSYIINNKNERFFFYKS